MTKLAILLLVMSTLLPNIASDLSTTSIQTVHLRPLQTKPGFRMFRPSDPLEWDFQPAPGDLQMVSPEWVVWRTSERLSARESHVHSLWYRYVIQEWIGAPAFCVAESSSSMAVIGVSSAGSLLMQGARSEHGPVYVVRSAWEGSAAPKFQGDIVDFEETWGVKYTLKKGKQISPNAYDVHLVAEGFISGGETSEPESIPLATLSATHKEYSRLSTGKTFMWREWRGSFPIIFRRGGSLFHVWDGQDWITVKKPQVDGNL